MIDRSLQGQGGTNVRQKNPDESFVALRLHHSHDATSLDEMNSTTVGMCDQIRSKLHAEIASLAGVQKGDVKFEVWLGETVNHMLDCRLSVAEALSHD